MGCGSEDREGVDAAQFFDVAVFVAAMFGRSDSSYTVLATYIAFVLLRRCVRCYICLALCAHRAVPRTKMVGIP
jgi:hypothetical protein